MDIKGITTTRFNVNGDRICLKCDCKLLTTKERDDSICYLCINKPEKPFPMPTCSVCGLVPWEEVRLYEDSRTKEVSTVVPYWNGKTLEFDVLETDIVDSDINNNYFFHVKTIHDPDPQEDECEGRLTMPKEME